MRLLYIADGRSPIALNWIRYFVERGYEVHLVSTFACQPSLDLASLHFVPVAFSGLRSGDPRGSEGNDPARWRSLGNLTVGLRTSLRQWLGPLTFPTAANKLTEIIERIKPDLVHAMRIPYEGMLAVLSKPAMPLLVSVWGNDFTYHASATPLMKRYTLQVLHGAQALHTDCHRDMEIAREWGFAMDKPGVVLPGAGGIQLDLFYPSRFGDHNQDERNWTVINPRGFRAYVRNDTFFHSIPVVLEQFNNVRFLCTTMAHEQQALHWVKELGISENVVLLPRQTRPQMAELFRSARLVVSPSVHDGTPNTLLEAMACGCLPAAGDIASLREWITPGQNGLLFDPRDHQSLAAAIIQGLRDDELYRRAMEYNQQLVAERADYDSVMPKAESFYDRLIQ